MSIENKNSIPVGCIPPASFDHLCARLLGWGVCPGGVSAGGGVCLGGCLPGGVCQGGKGVSALGEVSAQGVSA